MVKIKLPVPGEFIDPKQFFRQLELAVHHAEKSYDELLKSGEYTPDSFVTYRFPRLNLYGREEDEKGYVKVHVDKEDSLDIEIEIA